ncbi:DNA repair protein RecO [Gloeobacter violaceus]|uniref:DNA repair protein RecO n=1 Tax=Gloeobacter violaceus (strain ATCC 29082 / PCC 7421) TaxID=251221 RepID=RECO_GLOVI|nr:DNA repair protein RecO [Gloeobacter violaceus]Q7NPH1.1 RecName: Full=DNA repair protein RecO; AltName: Full=Recombination protein O [Gloeobacter violaceus PCC 7421]BAC88025.1 gll0084 [Gloeobacter violaceus PCC 7421]
MSGKTYRATGINLRRMPLGESDLLMTILTRENGLVRAVARGARKANARIGGRTEQFVVNDLQLYRGRSLDQLTQAESLRTFPGLLQDLGRLTAAQYLAEGVLQEATEGQAQEDLYDLLLVHLERLAATPSHQIAARLVHGVYQLLAVGGVAPEVHFCTVSHRPISAESAGFSVEGGGLVALECLSHERVGFRLDIEQVAALQLLADADLTPASLDWNYLWIGLERLLRRHIEFHFDRPLRAATLLEICFEPLAVPAAASPQ